VGAFVALGGGSAEQAVGLASLAAVPLLVMATLWAPEAVVGFIVFAQILELFELPTPLGTISPASVALVAFLAVRFREIIATASRPGYVLASVLLALYVAAHGLQVLHIPATQAVREMVTPFGFALFVVLGMYIGSRSRHLAAAGVGAACGLLALAVRALLANLLMVPGYAPMTSPRDILGITSPFLRTNGLDAVPVALLLGLTVPWLACTGVLTRRRSIRAAALASIATIEVSALLLFQSRSMVLECALAPIIVWALAGRSIPGVVSATTARQAIRMALGNKRTRRVAVVVAVGTAAALIVGVILALGDTLSTELRTNSYGAAINYFRDHPWDVIVGTNVNTFHQTVNQAVNAFLPLPDQINSDAPVHDFIIETLAAGGIVAALSLCLLAFGPILVIARAQLIRGQIAPAAATAMAAVIIAIMEASVTPTVANSGALWIILGWAVAVATPVVSGRERPPVQGRLSEPTRA
jgi:hypothetical protein